MCNLGCVFHPATKHIISQMWSVEFMLRHNELQLICVQENVDGTVNRNEIMH